MSLKCLKVSWNLGCSWDPARPLEGMGWKMPTVGLVGIDSHMIASFLAGI